MNRNPSIAERTNIAPASGVRPSPVLVAAFMLSLALHGVLLVTGFIDLSPPEVREHERGLEVTLVNARSEAPDDAQMLAQADLDAGGPADEEASPTAPAPAEDSAQEGEAVTDSQAAPEEAAELPREPETLTQDSTDDTPPAPARETQPEPAPPSPESAPRGRDLMDSISAVARLETQIDRSLDEYAERPRKRFIGASTREHRFAQYVENWRQKVERVGNMNYPERMHGSLLLSVVIRADGSVEDIEVRRSSGTPQLDEAAVRIVEMAAPFAPFPPNIREDTDIIEITRTWTFTNAERFHTH